MADQQTTITIRVDKEEHKKAKVVAALEGKTLKQIFLEAINRLAEKQKRG